MPKVLLKKEMPAGYGGIIVYDDKPNEPFFEVNQVHGVDVISPSETLQDADGLYLESPHELTKALAIKTADCLPITFIGKRGFSHIHAGWRGLHGGICEANVIKKLEPFYAFIGPAIHWDSYEVGPEFLEHFEGLSQCFRPGKAEDKYFFNLPLAAEVLIKSSYPEITVEVSDLDTYTTPGHNSYRRNQTKIRNYNVYYPEHLYKSL